MKDITLKITAKTVRQDLKGERDEDVMEFTTAGTLRKRGKITYIQYPETVLSGMEGCMTSLVIQPDKIRMKRSGEMLANDTVMEFEKGKRFLGVYETPYGPVGMEVLTNDVSNLETVDENRSKVSIDYHVCLKGLSESRNKLDIEIMHPLEEAKNVQ